MSEMFYHAYNFIPLGNRKPERKSLATGPLTGKITCTLTPVTDLFVPNTSNEGRKNENEPKESKEREFFSYEQLPDPYQLPDIGPKHPVIPGSELRGMVRSMYEAMTDSCMSAVDLDGELSARSGKPKTAGILHFDGEKWELIQANVYRMDYGPEEDRTIKGITEHTPMGKYHKDYPKRIAYFEKDKEDGILYLCLKGKKYKQNDVFSIKVDENKKDITALEEGDSAFYDDLSYYDWGYLVMDEQTDRKRKHYIFSEKYKGANFQKVNISSDEIIKAIRNYNNILKNYYRDSNVNKTDGAFHTNGKPLMYTDREISETPKSKSVFCVWYEKRAGKLYLSPAQIGREIFDAKLDDYIGEYRSCANQKKDINKESQQFCDACRLFGMIKEQESIGSRVRFSDAVFIGDAVQYQDVTQLKELSNPKITSMEMYLRCRDAAVGQYLRWTYDYIVEFREKKQNGRNVLREYCTKSALTEKLELSGRKMYYHHPKCQAPSYYEWPPSEDKNLDASAAQKRLTIVRPLQGNFNSYNIKNGTVKTFFAQLKAKQKKPINQFRFEVYYEHLTEDELKKLVAVLNLCGIENACYKLGMGKPLGLGSVMVQVDKVEQRVISNENGIRYEQRDVTADYWKDDDAETVKTNCFEYLSDEAWNQLKMMLDFGYTGDTDVQYPPNGYKWFMDNRGGVGDSPYSYWLKADGKLPKKAK